MILRMHHHQRHFGFAFPFIGFNQLSLHRMRFTGIDIGFFSQLIGVNKLPLFGLM